MSRSALVIGGGPAGLMAAEMLAQAGHPVTIAEAMPTPARKFLMAGKSGLNLTKDQPRAAFLRQFSGSVTPAVLGLGLEDFAAPEVMLWAQGLGVDIFTGSTGRVFPRGMKASPLLRAWLARLAGLGAVLQTRWRWTGWDDAGGVQVATPDGPQTLHPGVTVLALGGASWPRLGSDAAWTDVLRRAGVEIAGFRPANMGFRAEWTPAMARHFGQPVKGTAIRAGRAVTRGEWIIGREGVEGGAIYEISAPLRDGAPGFIDLAPDLTQAELARRLAVVPAKLSLGNRLRRVLGDPLRAALLMEWGQPLPGDAGPLAALAKALPLRHAGPMGVARAISSAGGITAAALSDALELRARPGTFVAGEMLDWEAPTGGYLLTGCLASGRKAGLGAGAYLARAAI